MQLAQVVPSKNVTQTHTRLTQLVLLSLWSISEALNFFPQKLLLLYASISLCLKMKIYQQDTKSLTQIQATFWKLLQNCDRISHCLLEDLISPQVSLFSAGRCWNLHLLPQNNMETETDPETNTAWNTSPCPEMNNYFWKRWKKQCAKVAVVCKGGRKMQNEYDGKHQKDCGIVQPNQVKYHTYFSPGQDKAQCRDTVWSQPNSLCLLCCVCKQNIKIPMLFCPVFCDCWECYKPI